MRAALPLTFLLLGAACAGTGGSNGGGSPQGSGPTDDGSPASSSSPTIGPGDELPAPGESFASEGQAVVASFSQAGLDDFEGPVGAQIEFLDTDDDGEADLLRLTADGETVELSGDGASVEEILDGRFNLVSNAAGDAVFIELDEDSGNFADFGGWATTSGPGGTPQPGDKVNMAVYGGQTPASAMPTGAATYSGTSVGVHDNGADVRVTPSEVTVRTPDFNAVTVESDNTVAQSVAGGAPVSDAGLDFAASGSVSGNAFSASGDGMQVDGHFFGDAAQEAGGTFRGRRNGGTYGGAFVGTQ